MFRGFQVIAAGGVQPERGRIAVYSCWFGDYEPYNPLAMGPEGPWDRILFTDDPKLEPEGVRVVRLKPGRGGLSPKQMSREPKLWPERYLARYDWVIYVDNRAILMMPPNEIVAAIEGLHGEAAPAGRYLLPHQQRNCAWQELRECRRLKMIDSEEHRRVKAIFSEEDYPKGAGLYVNTCMVQKMGCPATEEMNRAWFDSFLFVVGRDQILLPFILWSMQISPQLLEIPHQGLIRWPLFGKQRRKNYQSEAARRRALAARRRPA